MSRPSTRNRDEAPIALAATAPLSYDARVPLRAKTVRLRVRLGRAVSDAQRAWTEREAIALAITDGEIEAMAEAAPLPGVSPEAIDAVERALVEIAWNGVALDEDPLSIAARVVPEELPSARFAVEAALLDLVGRRSGLSVATLIAEGPPSASVLTAALLDELETALARARAALAAGAGALKVKIGRPGQAEAETSLLRALREELGDEVRIRADANGMLEGPGDPRIDALAAIGAELVEDPFASLDAIFAARLPVPVALDEHLARDPRRALQAIEQGRASILVLKPALLGGIGRSLALAEAARQRGARAIVSHLYDPPRALAACAHLALAIGGEEVHGLARYIGLDAWTSRDGRSIPVPEMIGAYRIDPPETGGLG